MLPNEEKKWSWIVPTDFESKGVRADIAILTALTPSGELTRNQLKRLIEEGQVTVNGQTIKPSTQLKAGDSVQIFFPLPQSSKLIAEDRPIEILFEDEHLAIVNKPQGLTVHPSPSQMEGTLVHALLHHIRDLSGIGGVLRPGIVHRIDKDTSGALVITKTDQAHFRLSEIFSRHEIERCYWALCYGAPPPSRGIGPHRIESKIGRNPADRKKMSMKVTTGKSAITYYEVKNRFGHLGKAPFAPFASWLQLTLETGRTHQIRVHLTGMGCSILGDPVYGTPTENQPKFKLLPTDIRKLVQELPGQALHARTLGFQHPITGKPIHVEAEPPAIFLKLLEKLENDYSIPNSIESPRHHP